MSRKKGVECTLRADAFLLNPNGKKCDFVETVPEADQFRLREELRAMGSRVFEETLEVLDKVPKFKIRWLNTIIEVQFQTPIDANEIKDVVHSFHESACDGYLEGDARIFRDYELIFDNFRWQCGQEKAKEIPDYWEWAQAPPEIKEWVLDTDETSVSIRNNETAIPHAKEWVTKEKIVYFDFGGDDPTTVVFSRRGFTVEDLVVTAQEIISKSYERSIDLFDEDEIGAITNLYFNPRTKHVSVSIVFD